MDNAPADIIQQATDILTSDNREVKLYLIDSESFGGVRVRWGTLTGLGSMGDHATITVENYRDSRGLITKRTLIELPEIISLDRA